MLKTLMTTVAVGALTIGAANAQSTTTTTPAPSAPAATTTAPASGQIVNSQTSNQLLSSKFIGTDVIGANDEKIGDVSDVLFDKDGKVHAYIVGVGGFLGIGAKDVALAPASFRLVPGENNAPEKLRLSMTKEQLQQAAAFEPYNGTRTTTGSGTTGGMNPRPAGSTAPAR